MSVVEFPWSYPESSITVASGEEGVLGRGAYGEVRRAVWCGIHVACKRLHSFAAENELLLEEMRLLATLRHPNLVLFLGVVYDDSTKAPTSILTEMLPYSLYDLLEVHRVKLEVAEALDVAMDVAQALKYLHSHDPAIVHRDLSSKNILMGYGRAKLSDLGQAKMLSDVNSHAQANTTMPGAMAYSAPEVLTGIYDKSIDVFSFGVLVVQLCTGEFPRIDRRREQLRAAVARCPFLASLIERCLHLQPQDRPAISDVIAFLKSSMESNRLYDQDANQAGDVGILAKRSMRRTIDTHIKELRQQLAITEKRLSASEERLKQEMLRADQSDSELQTARQTEAQLHQQLSQLHERNEELHAQYLDADGSRQQMAATERESAEAVLSLKQQVSQLNRSITMLNEELDTSTTHCKNLRDELQATEAAKLDLEQTHMQALHGAEEIRAQLNMQLEATRELDLQLAQALHRWQAEQLSRSSVEKSLRDAHRITHSLQTEKSELVGKVQSLQQQIAFYNADSEQKASQETGVRLELQDLQRHNEHLERTVERLRADATECTKDLESMRAALNHQASQKQEAESKNIALMRQQSELSEQVKRLTEQLAQLDAHACNMKSERDQLRHQLAAMQIITDSSPSHRKMISTLPADSEVAAMITTTSKEVVVSPKAISSDPSTTESDTKQVNTLEVETDRAVKNRVLDAIQQGPRQLLDLMQKEMADIRLAWRCVRYLKSYAQEDLRHREQLADLGAFPVLITALRAHHQMRDMQLEGMKAVAAAVFKSNRCRRLAGEAALPQYVCHVLQQYASDATVVAQACTALTNLAHNSFENKDRAVEMDGVRHITAAMERFLGDQKVQTQAAWTLLTLAASDTVSIEIAKMGGAAALINAISHHRTNEQVVYYASWALNNLAACPDVRVKEILVKAGIGEACSLIVDHFPAAGDIIGFVQSIAKQLRN